MITAMIREFVILYKFGAQTEGGIQAMIEKFVVHTVALLQAKIGTLVVLQCIEIYQQESE